ncbi:MAG: hypothetical protein RSC23_04455 [Carnobacterium sp.]|uniref:hypothetical protein n=1 Tax=Carnobacterium sp. TaxID=48221 RepID=UPI002FCAFA9A
MAKLEIDELDYVEKVWHSKKLVLIMEQLEPTPLYIDKYLEIGEPITWDSSIIEDNARYSHTDSDGRNVYSYKVTNCYDSGKKDFEIYLNDVQKTINECKKRGFKVKNEKKLTKLYNLFVVPRNKERMEKAYSKVSIPKEIQFSSDSFSFHSKELERIKSDWTTKGFIIQNTFISETMEVYLLLADYGLMNTNIKLK